MLRPSDGDTAKYHGLLRQFASVPLQLEATIAAQAEQGVTGQTFGWTRASTGVCPEISP